MVKASEYQKSFKVRPETAQIHQDGFDYRLERRKAEHHHSIDAFSWDTGSDDSENAEQNVRSGSVLTHKQKHEKFNKTYKEKLSQSQELNLQKQAAPVTKSNKGRKDATEEDDLRLELPTPVESECREIAKVNGSCPAQGKFLS